MDAKRYCKIESASVELANGGGDGAYGLLGIEGSPEDIGKAIAEELATGDMSQGPAHLLIADGDDELYLTVRIRFARHELAPIDD